MVIVNNLKLEITCSFQPTKLAEKNVSNRVGIASLTADSKKQFAH